MLTSGRCVFEAEGTASANPRGRSVGVCLPCLRSVKERDRGWGRMGLGDGEVGREIGDKAED